MKNVIFPTILLAASAAVAADAPSTPGGAFDQQLKTIESELVPLAEAMPADKYDFAPKNGEFAGVRTFGQQVSHIAAVIYLCSASVLGEPVPEEAGEGESGPSSLKTKDDIVKYLKASFVYGHKAMNSVTAQNMLTPAKSPFGGGQVPRLSMITVPVWHSFDHYGQMVVYARMNGIIPPASRK
jgi:DinB family protein